MTALLGGCFSVFGCAEKTSGERCGTAASHMSRILYAAAENDASPAALERQQRATKQSVESECKSKWTEAGVDCVLAAKTRKEIRHCSFW